MKPVTAAIASLVLTAAACVSAQEPAPSGATLYANNCAACHGAQGEGDGPVAAAMKVSVPNLRTLSQRNKGVFPAEDVRAYIDGRTLPAGHGDRYMPVWGNEFGWGGKGRAATEKEVAARIDAIVDYLRGIQYR